MSIIVHNIRNTIVDLIAMSAAIIFVIFSLQKFNDYGILAFNFAISITFFSFAIYNLAVDNEKIVIEEDHISVLMLGMVNIKLKWDDINYVEICKVGAFGSANYYEIYAIICSKKSIKFRERPYGNIYYKVVPSNWVLLSPKSAIMIPLDSLESGQYAEFWSYVPERLKKDSQKRGLYSKENCC